MGDAPASACARRSVVGPHLQRGYRSRHGRAGSRKYFIRHCGRRDLREHIARTQKRRYDAAENLVKLLQLCVEHMLHVQESLINDASKAELGRRKALDEVRCRAKLSLEKLETVRRASAWILGKSCWHSRRGARRRADTARWIDS